jgi:hypothetical protein
VLACAIQSECVVSVSIGFCYISNISSKASNFIYFIVNYMLILHKI